MSELAPLVIGAPLLGAAITLVVGTITRRRTVIDACAVVAALVTVAITSVLFVSSIEAPIVTWFGGWTPSDGVAIGISLVVDPLGASLALLAALLTAASLVFSWRYFDAVGGLYQVLILVFLAAMVGFALSGDLFNMFVFFELMSVSAFALTGYKTEESEPLQGALNFGVVNGIGAFLILSGIGLLYGRTGALNLAQLGETLAGRELDGLVTVAFVFILVGFFIKAAMVPFHFWLADAYAVAPAPVCVLFAGVMSELGVYAIALVYWTVFEGPLGVHGELVRNIVVAVGATTGVMGGLLCFAQRRLKRIMAFATMSHAGLFLVGVGLLTPAGLGGVIVYLIADALVKAALFFSFGMLLHRYGSGDELFLHGRGRDARLLGIFVVLGALGFAGLPPFGTYLGKAMIEEASSTLGFAWMTAVFMWTSVLTAAAVLRVAGRIFLGWGPAPRPREGGSADEEDEEAETSGGSGTTPVVMLVPTVLFALLALGSGFTPDLPTYAEELAERFQDRSAYELAVLEGIPPASPDFDPPEPPPENQPSVEPVTPEDPRPKGAVLGVAATLFAVLLAVAALNPDRVPAAIRKPVSLGAPALRGLRALHSGHVGDYVAWVTVGVAMIGGVFALGLR